MVNYLDKGILILLFLAIVIIPVVGAAEPLIASFTASPMTGPAPLTVTFTDQSTGNPIGWAWYFGDETYTQSWTQQTASAGWSGRVYHSSVAMPDGSIVLMGGEDNNNNLMNDVWRSTDNGATWTQMTASAGWSAREGHSSVTMPDGSIVLMGGVNGEKRLGYGGGLDDVWRSTDNGATWMQMTASAGWSGREPNGWSGRAYHSSVAMPDGSIVLMGGNYPDVHTGLTGFANDVWRSTDNGATWTQMTASAGWSGRKSHSSVAMPDGSIVLMGGQTATEPYLRNDVWRSTNNGATWTQVNASAGWTARFGHSSVAMPDGSIVLMSGFENGNNGTVWWSMDNSATWTQLPDSGWWGRYGHTSVELPDGSIVLMGGSGDVKKNDVWRFMPAGSSAQNPTHTYTIPGVYTVQMVSHNSTTRNPVSKTTITVLSPSLLSVTAISPSTGTNDQSISATITGTGFKPGALVKFTRTGQPDIVASSVNLTGNSLITCAFDLNGKATGTWDLAVTNPVDGTTSVRSTAFTLSTPQIINKNETITPATPHITSTNGTIIVSSTPQDALVYLDGSLKGTGSVTLQDVSPGEHSVRVTKPMYNDYGTDVRVATGSTSYVYAVLTPVSGTSGTIIASSNPAGASVYLDGMDKGISPFVISGVSSGSHTVSFTKTGYTSVSRPVTMTAGQTMDITVDLTKTGGDWGEWLNTTTLIIVGIIVVIIAIIVILLRKKKNRWDNY